MVDRDVQQPSGRSHLGSGSAFDLVSAKLRRPVLRPGTVRRSSLIERLARGNECPIVSVVAPAGYGKTTLLAQWAERNGQAFAWVSVDEGDNDPKVLLTYVAEALDRIEPIDGRVFQALASSASSVPGSVVPRLGAAFSSMTSPVVLVLDDVHLLHDTECRAALSLLADHVPDGSRLVLAGRTMPRLRIARLRAEGRILEIGPEHLSLARAEAAALLRHAELKLDDDDVTELHKRTEGWPAGLYLAALYLKEGGSLANAPASFGGEDRLVSEYVESEFLARISRRQRDFLTHTAVLERMSGPLCEAVLGVGETATTLADLARSNLLLVPLDRRGGWYRYHHLFRDMLLAELERVQPQLVPVLRRRAADWSVRNDLPEEALHYFIAAGDADEAARLVEKLWLPNNRQGRSATLERWFRWLDEQGAIERHPKLAVWRAFLAIATGRPAEADRWAYVVDRWQSQDRVRADDPLTEAWAAGLRATLCRSGVEQMRADADEAVQRCSGAGLAAPVTALLQGVARVLCGDLVGGDASLEDAVIGATNVGAHEIAADALCERSLVAIARRRWDQAEAHARQAETVLLQAGIEDIYTMALICAAQARVAMHRGRVPEVREHLVRAQRVRHLLTYAVPHFAVQARIELIRVHLALGDTAGARTLMRETDELLKRRPGLGTLAAEAQALRVRVSGERGPSTPGASSLTTAELRLMPMLATHLSFPEIADDLFLSPHTIKSQAVAIYRKLGVGSRSQAVDKARDVGLLEK